MAMYVGSLPRWEPRNLPGQKSAEQLGKTQHLGKKVLMKFTANHNGPVLCSVVRECVREPCLMKRNN